MNYTKIKTEDILSWLKNNLNETRYLHSLGTAQCAKELAQRYALDSDKAYIAGLLHDCAKCFPTEKLLSIIDAHIDIEEQEKLSYKTLHAPVSAYIAKTEFGVDDSEILSSIRWHTIGKINMSNFEKIIFLADKIEPNTRDKKHSNQIKNILNEDRGLDKALLMCYKATIISLVERDLRICMPTIDIYNELEQIISKS